MLKVCFRPHRPGSLGVTVAVVLTAVVIGSVHPALARVFIQEVLYDGLGGDGDDAFTELIGPPGTSLDGWSLVGINGDTGTSYRAVDLTGATIPLDGVLVVATTSANDSLAAVRDLIGSVDWQNGPDAVQLVDSAGSIIDAVQYGDAGAFNAGEGSAATGTSPGESLSRDGAGTDTGDNLADFTIRIVPSPGVGIQPHGGAPGTNVMVSLPDTTAFGGDTLTVPVRFTDTAGHGLLAVELFLTFDRDLLAPLDVLPADLIAARRWQLASNVIANSDGPIDTLRIALATDIDTLAGVGPLVHIRFLVADLRRPATTDLRIEHLALNDGRPTVEQKDGSVRLIGVGASLITAPVPIMMHDSLHVTVTDPDVNRDATRLDTLAILVREGPENSPPEQAETLHAVETDPASGVFTSSIAIVYADAVSATGVIETAPRRELELCFDDSLDAVGATTRHCTLLAVPAHDGHLDATVVTEPGDTLWIRLVDGDLNRRPDAVDTAIVAIVNHVTADTQSARLVEIGLNDSTFFGHFATSTVAGTDTLLSSYLDVTPTVGDSARVADTTHVLGHFGDADGDGQLQAFDAARILHHVLAPDLSGRDSLAANVDSLAPFGVISPFDAALVLQHRVGLRRRFPVQESVAANHPRPVAVAGDGPGPVAAKLATRVDRRVELRHTGEYLSVWLDDRSDIISGDLLLAWEDLVVTHVERASDLQSFLLASQPVRPPGVDRSPYVLRVVLAGVVAATGPGELFRLYPSRAVGFYPGTVRLVSSRFNDGQIPARIVEVAAVLTPRAAFALHTNHPNPFNAGTVISLELAESGFVELDVIDLLGQRVRRLVAAQRRAGPHRVPWDGLDGDGRPAATGIYLSRLRAGGGERTRRMLLLR